MKINILATKILDQIYPKRKYIDNIFDTDNEKSVLISYITAPFLNKGEVKFTHSNNSEAGEIASIFNKLGYNVDVIRYNCDFGSVKFARDKYDLVFGIEPNFLRATRKFKPTKSIYYATGAYCKFQNQAESLRIADLQKRRGVIINPVRQVSIHNSSDLADGVICFGNDWTESTYRGHYKKIETIRTSSFDQVNLHNIKPRDFSKAKKNFLWFGSIGAVHKGLDLLLEIFPKHPNLVLHVCGDVTKETGLAKIYHKELFWTKNIILHGWTKPDSVEYKEIVESCAFTILPSCSEGMSGAVTTGMHAGLIPLVSQECGLDVAETGKIFQDNSINSVEATIISFSEMADSILSKLSNASFAWAEKNSTIDVFRRDFTKALKNLL